MPFYSITVSVPPNTPATAPATATLEIFPGVVVQVWLQFPRFCAGLVHARILRAGSQIWPANEDSDVASDGFVVNWPEEYDMTDEPTALTLSAWNLDDTYPHSVTLWLATRDAASFKAAQQQSNLLAKFLQLVGLK